MVTLASLQAKLIHTECGHTRSHPQLPMLMGILSIQTVQVQKLRELKIYK